LNQIAASERDPQASKFFLPVNRKEVIEQRFAVGDGIPLIAQFN
jgi:hypothetical protein